MPKLRRKIVGCEHCVYRQGDFFKDPEDLELVRCYCSARHGNILTVQMSKNCDFFQVDPEVLAANKKSKPEVQGI